MYVGTAEYLSSLTSDYFVTWISRILFAILFDTLICLYLLSVYRVEGNYSILLSVYESSADARFPNCRVPYGECQWSVRKALTFRSHC